MWAAGKMICLGEMPWLFPRNPLSVMKTLGCGLGGIDFVGSLLGHEGLVSRFNVQGHSFLLWSSTNWSDAKTMHGTGAFDTYTVYPILTHKQVDFACLQRKNVEAYLLVTDKFWVIWSYFRRLLFLRIFKKTSVENPPKEIIHKKT